MKCFSQLSIKHVGVLIISIAIMRHIRIFHKCQILTDKSVARVTVFASQGRVMLNCDPSDRFVYQYLTLMIDSF